MFVKLTIGFAFEGLPRLFDPALLAALPAALLANLPDMAGTS